MAVLSGSCFTHDLATPECLLLACWHAVMTVGCKVIDRKRAIVIHMRVKRQQQRRTLLHQSNTHVATAMNPTLVAFGTFEPALQIQIVFWKISCLSTHKQPRRKTAHHFGKLLLNGVSACLPRLPQRDELRLPLLLRGLVTCPQGAIHSSQVWDILPYVLQGLACHRQAAVNASGQTLQQRLCTPPFWASKVRSSDSRTSCNASLIRTPGGCSGPPWSSLRMPRTAAQYPNTTSPASSSTSGAPVTAQAGVPKALAVWPAPRSCRAQASGAAASGMATHGVSSAWGGPGAGEGSRAAVRRRSSSTRRSIVRNPRTLLRILTFA